MLVCCMHLVFGGYLLSCMNGVQVTFESVDSMEFQRSPAGLPACLPVRPSTSRKSKTNSTLYARTHTHISVLQGRQKRFQQTRKFSSFLYGSLVLSFSFHLFIFIISCGPVNGKMKSEHFIHVVEDNFCYNHNTPFYFVLS